jgi:pantoate--beta-alanine ligase
MEILRTPAEFRAWSRSERAAGRTHGFVPTMGALHEGHASLLRRAGELTDSVSLSIYVNPTQFGPNEDFSKYPRTWEHDLAIAEREGVKAVFAPESIYPRGYRTEVVVPGWNAVLEGAIRPGHFDGVASVVTKLFHAAECDVAVFGQKDAQQALLIRRMIRDLDFPLKLVVAPTVREPDGLAMSSRNRYLSPEDRSRALAISRALRASVATWESGCRTPAEVVAAGWRELGATPPDSVDYFTLLDPETLDVLDEAPSLTGPAILVAAARYGSTRLLDNAVLGPVWD